MSRSNSIWWWCAWIFRCVFVSAVLSIGPLGVSAREIHVHGSNLNASDSGAGEASRPFRTIAQAVRQMMPGDRLVIHAGVYRDAILLPERDWESGGQTIIEGVAGEDVLILGSDILNGWRAMGDGLFVRVMQQEPQQVFVDGKPLKQIGGSIFGGYPTDSKHSLSSLHQGQGGIWPARVDRSPRDLPVDSFFFSNEAKALYVKIKSNSLELRNVEVSVRPYLVFGKGLVNFTLRHLRFMHATTSTTSRAAAITLIGKNITVDDVHISQVDSVGLEISGSGVDVKNSSANYCGQLGFKARGKYFNFVNNETSWNNTRGFNKWWESGGAKFVGQGGLQKSFVTGHRAISNNGDGIWFDWKNSSNVVEKSIVAYNNGFGIQYEASDRARITDNFVFGNYQRGIYLPHSSDSIISHNTIFMNGLEGIVVIDEGRKDPEGAFDLRPRNNKIYGNVLAWNNGAVILPKNVAGNYSDSNVFIGSNDQILFSLGWPRFGRGSMVNIDTWRNEFGFDKNSFTSYAVENVTLLKNTKNKVLSAYLFFKEGEGVGMISRVDYSIGGEVANNINAGVR